MSFGNRKGSRNRLAQFKRCGRPAGDWRKSGTGGRVPVPEHERCYRHVSESLRALEARLAAIGRDAIVATETQSHRG